MVYSVIRHEKIDLARSVYKNFVEKDLPENDIILFKDKNHLNCKLSNLYVKRKYQKVIKKEKELRKNNGK